MNLQGPRGGDLNNPAQQPEARRSPFNAALDPFSGLPQLHRKDGFNDVAVAGRKNEQPWHRMAAYMLLAGRSNSEVAMAANVTPGTVAHLRSNRWFQELLATLANSEGEELVGLIRSEAQNSFNKLVELRDDEEAGRRVNLAAATLLFEQAAGKATQRTLSVSTTTSFNSEQEELQAIKTELAAIRNQEAV